MVFVYSMKLCPPSKRKEIVFIADFIGIRVCMTAYLYNIFLSGDGLLLLNLYGIIIWEC